MGVDNNVIVIVSAVATIVSAIAAAFAALQAAKSAKTAQEQLEQSKTSSKETSDAERTARTLKAYVNLEENAISKLYGFTEKEIYDISKHPRDDDYKLITSYMNYLETFALGLETNFYDEDILNKMELSHLARLYVNLIPIVEKKRSMSHKQDYRNLEAWGNLLRERYPNINSNLERSKE